MVLVQMALFKDIVNLLFATADFVAYSSYLKVVFLWTCRANMGTYVLYESLENVIK